MPGGELLVFVADDGNVSVHVRFSAGTLWLTQKAMAELYRVSVPTINEHLGNIYDTAELAPEATIRKFRIVQTDGDRSVQSDFDRVVAEAQRLEHDKLLWGLRLREGVAEEGGGGDDRAGCRAPPAFS